MPAPRNPPSILSWRELTIERNAAARRKLSDLQMAIGRNDGEVRQLTQRIFAAQRVLEDREAIETAVAKLKDLEATSLLYRSETADLDHAVNELSRERSRLNALQIDIMADWHRAKKRLDGIGAILARKASVEKATSELPVAEASLAEAKQALEVAELHFAEVSNARLSGTEDREKYLRGGVEEIAVDAHTEGVGHARRMAQGIISEHDRMLLAAASHPTQMAAATADVKSARTQFKTRESNLASLRLTASQAEEVSRVEATKDTEEAEIARLNSAIADCKKHLAEASEDLVRKQAERKESLTRHEALKQEMAPYEAKALLAGQIASAETRLSELQPQIEKLTDEGLRLASELTSLEVPVDPVLPDVNSFQSKYRAAQDEYLSAKSSLSVMEDAMKRAVESSGKLKELSSERAKAEVELSDWTRLQKDLGKSGIQAIEVDAAAPELSELTNELLAHSFGSRWTVTFETTRLGSDGKEIEDYRIMVFDNQTGRTADISTYSGGEKAILGEAVRNSLAIVAHRSSGESGGLTLVRDETTGPLDEGIAPHYIEMLRKVADMVDASKVLFIAHNSALWDLADARVAVAAGQLTIS
jgi:DNA repair exonuclease SbcCD ATPase subunit